MVLLSIGTFLCALSFAFLAVCLAVLLQQTSRILKHTGETVDQVEKMTDDLVHGIERTILEGDQLLDDLEEKLVAVDPLVASAGHIGDAVEASASALNIQARKLAAPENLNKIDQYVKAITWSEVASRIYKKWKVADTQS
ncbi:DUF948 domain-containing protein [Aciduricibacillus chroicocephali]|uniref:DUF948 domain-containing protein n=1 Tax=Aciduricibacillus chroicocephali TaxID=3054939 RepID=A0ABY9KXA4_9BACI|nr:DUF948 domain-containing protein [Bacillaceae bacterium 44XB]